jgi:DNA gyrase/topoisomerase IV subunit A
MQQKAPFETERMRDRLAILDAMCTVIERRQDLMNVVASAADSDDGRAVISAHFGFNDTDATAVLDLQVRRFADRERRRILVEADGLRRQLG